MELLIPRKVRDGVVIRPAIYIDNKDNIFECYASKDEDMDFENIIHVGNLNCMDSLINSDYSVEVILQANDLRSL